MIKFIAFVYKVSEPKCAIYQLGASASLLFEGFKKEGFNKEGFKKGRFRKRRFQKEGFKKEGFIEEKEGFFFHCPCALRAVRGVGKVLNTTGFIRFSDMVGGHVRFIYKPNAFLIIFDAVLRFGLQNHWNCTGFIRYFD